MSLSALFLKNRKQETILSKSENKIKEEHEFTTAINAFINEGINFGSRFIKDSNARIKYKNLIEASALEIITEVNNGKLNIQAAAHQAHAMRNDLLELIRSTSSDMGRAFARKLKYNGRTFDYLLNEKSQRIFNRSFSELSYDHEREKIFLEIIESSGGSRTSVNRMAKTLGKVGRSLTIVSIGILIYELSESNDKWGVIEQEATGFALGSMLSMAGGWAGMACGPGAVICVPMGVFLGGALGALGAEYAFHWRR